MMNQNYLDWGYFGIGFPMWFPPLFVAIMIWGLFWKGLGLWHSARRAEHWWFIALLLINTLGILEIIYLFGFAKIKPAGLFSTHSHHTQHTS